MPVVVYDDTLVSGFSQLNVEEKSIKPLKALAITQEYSSSNSDMSSEENDDVTPMHGEQVEWLSFRQVDYLWLFDP